MRRPAKTVVTIGGLAMLMASCAEVGPNYVPPAPPTAQTYAMPGDDPITGPTQVTIGEQVASDWWTLFQSPQLDQLVRAAIANNRSLAEARARLAASRDAAKTEGGQLTADLTAGFQRERANLNAFSGGAFSQPGLGNFPTNPEYNLYSVGPSVSYNLDLFGGKRRRRESLQATADAQARELDAAYLSLTGQVVEQALIIAEATIEIRALQEIGSNDQSDLDILRKAVAAGGATRASVSAAEGVLAQDEAAIPVRRQRLAAARHRMAILIGKAPSEWSPPEFDETSGVLPLNLPLAVPSQLVRNRPDIQEAEAQLHAATAEIGVATANLYPNITLSGRIAQDALTPGTFFDQIANSWSVGTGLTAPLFHSGELKAKQQEEKDNALAALAAYQQTVLEAFGQVDDALQAVGHDNQAYAEQSQAVDAASARLEMMRKAVQAGGASAEDLVKAKRDYHRLRLTLAQQGTSRYDDAARLLLATATVPKQP